MQVKASLQGYHIAPRKVRLLADMVKGKGAKEAMHLLDFAGKRSSVGMKKLLASAVANANHNFKLDDSELYVREARVDKGLVMKRSMPRAFGRAYPIKRRTSNIIIVLDTKENKKK